jgi:hypothetical protein
MVTAPFAHNQKGYNEEEPARTENYPCNFGIPQKQDVCIGEKKTFLQEYE